MSRPEEPRPVLAPPVLDRPTLAPPKTEEATPAAPKTLEPTPMTPKPDEPLANPLKPTEPTTADPKAAGPSPEFKRESAATEKEPVRNQGDPMAPDGAGRSPADRAGAGRATDNTLFTRQSPILGVDTVGPKRIAVGKESTYELILHNSGQVAADQVVVTVDLPAWAEVVGSEASTGTASGAVPGPGRPAAGADPLRWKVGRLEAKGREKLVLRIVPRQSKPFDLAVKWDYTPVSSQTMIEVQEPKLEVRLHGPREVLYGKSEVYRLELSNPGTGDAENVVISLLPEGTGENTPTSHRLGTLAAGEKKSIEVELTARQIGNLTIKVDAQADGGLSARLAERIVVQRAALTVSVDAPSVQYVGSDVSYRIRVKNPGTAPAAKVDVTASIPRGSKYVSCTRNGRVAAGQSKISWTLENLTPGGEMVLELTCNLAAPGSSRLQVTSTADNDLMAQGFADIQVEAMADLTLSVKDPTAPVPVGSDAAYELRIQNRGTRAAEGVDVVVYFSEGVEPVSAEGSPNRVARGQVVFTTIPLLAATESLTLKVKARAERAGNHIIRTEVHCRPLGTRLVSEETTHFYDSSRGTAQAETTPADRAALPPWGGRLRTANRREPAQDSPSSGLPVPAPAMK